MIIILAWQLLNVIILLFVGYLTRLYKIFDQSSIMTLTSFIMKITLPAMLLNAGSSANIDNLGSLMIIFIFFVIYFILSFIIIGSLTKIFKTEAKLSNAIMATGVYGNFGFLGIPLIDAVIGSKGVICASIALIVFNLFFFSYTIAKFDAKAKFSIKKLISPALIGSFIMLAMVLTKFHLPEQITPVIKQVGDITTPLSMIVIGAMIYDAELKDLVLDIKVQFLNLIRLIIVPFCFIFILLIFNFDYTIFSAILIVLATPVATMVPIAAKQYDILPNLVSNSVASSTIFSLLTMPAILYIGQLLYHVFN